MRLPPIRAVAALSFAACSGDLGPPKVVPEPTIPVVFQVVNGSDSLVRVTIHAQVYDRTADTTYRLSNTLLNLLSPRYDFRSLFSRECHVGCVVRMGADITQTGPVIRGFVLPPDTVRLIVDTLVVRFQWPQDTARAVEVPVPPLGTFPTWP